MTAMKVRLITQKVGEDGERGNRARSGKLVKQIA